MGDGLPSLARNKPAIQFELVTTLSVRTEVARVDWEYLPRWIWQHSVADVSYTGWAPGFPKNFNSEDDCAVLSSHEGYKWTDVR